MESVLLIRFSIEKLNELPGPYEFQKGYLVGQAVSSKLLQGMTVLEGDTLNTLKGREYVSVVALKGERQILKNEIEPRILLNESISRRKAEPLTLMVRKVTDHLTKVGTVLDGMLEDTGWCSKGFRYAWD